ncbi:hypothetical protein, partial [uncultured Propionibacterium sp.]|uniref:hypothetical protein n=1 Tax=uncultured Propionibacterium sp. TaxID=218066 RepID=UPI00292F4FD3
MAVGAPSTLGVVETVLDAGRLSELTGRDVRAGRIRIKPGTSVAVCLEEPATGGAAGWARVLWPGGRSKADKAGRWAVEHGLAAAQRRLAGGLLIQHGEILADPG